MWIALSLGNGKLVSTDNHFRPTGVLELKTTSGPTKFGRYLTKRLEISDSKKPMTEAPFANGLANVWTFRYPKKIGGKKLDFKIYGFDEDTGLYYFIEHAIVRTSRVFLKDSVLFGRKLLIQIKTFL